MKHHLETGKKGELLAVKYLENLGYTILHSNWRFQRFEVDIIAQIGQELVFIEVKTRKNTSFGMPYESVDDRKRELLLQAAEAFLEENKLDLEVRFDIISITIKNNNFQIEHIPSAFSGF
ncbi:MAG: YraN family protein [Flavobacteriales bacterium]|nr:YraN family protein [Flavobacteriales bacterium]